MQGDTNATSANYLPRLIKQIRENVSLKNSIEFAGNNISTMFAIANSGIQHLSGQERNARLTPSDLLNIVAIFLAALYTLHQAANEISKAIPNRFEGKLNINLKDTVPPQEREALEDFSKARLTRTTRIQYETAVTQFILSVGLILLIMFRHKHLSGSLRFVIDTLFYIFETLNYNYNLKALQDIKRECDDKFQPKTLHSAFTTPHIEIENNAPILSTITTGRRRSALEALRHFVATLIIRSFHKMKTPIRPIIALFLLIKMTCKMKIVPIKKMVKT